MLPSRNVLRLVVTHFYRAKSIETVCMKQLVMYHSLVLMFKTKMDKKPKYIYEHSGDNPGRHTRQEQDRVGSNLLKDVRNLKTGTAKKSFIPRTVQDWNNLPVNLREARTLVLFKKELRAWISSSIPIK